MKTVSGKSVKLLGALALGIFPFACQLGAAGYYWTRGDQNDATWTSSWFDKKNWQGGAWAAACATSEGWNLAPSTGYLANPYPTVTYNATKGTADSNAIRPGYINSGWVGDDTTTLEYIQINKNADGETADERNGIARATSINLSVQQDASNPFRNVTPGFQGDGTLRIYTYQASTPSTTATVNYSTINGSYDTDFTFDVNVTLSCWSESTVANAYVRIDAPSNGKTLYFTDGHILNINKNKDADTVLGGGVLAIHNTPNSTADRNIVINSTIYAANVRLEAGNRSDTNKYGTITTIGGSSSNVISGQMFIADTAVVHFNKSNNALVTSTLRLVRGAKVIFDQDGQLDETVNVSLGNPFIADTTSSYYGISGIFDLNGHSTRVGRISIDNQSTTKVKNLAYIDMGSASGANTFHMKDIYFTPSFIVNMDLDESAIIIQNYELGVDHVYSDERLSSIAVGTTGYSSMDFLVFEGFSLDDYYILENYEDSVGAWEYIPTLIPEPSAFAAFIGILALAFAVCRKKK